MINMEFWLSKFYKEEIEQESQQDQLVPDIPVVALTQQLIDDTVMHYIERIGKIDQKSGKDNAFEELKKILEDVLTEGYDIGYLASISDEVKDKISLLNKVYEQAE